jgi:DNA-binding NarL/FixJ family response regulator
MEPRPNSSLIRVLVVDDHPVVRAGLASMLRKQRSVHVVGAVQDGEEALAFLEQNPADIMLLDLRMPKMTGTETLKRLRQIPSHPKVLILSSFDLEEEIFRSVQAGASGYISKDAPGEEIVEAIVKVHRGEDYFPPHIAAKLANRSSRLGLTAREIEILEMMAVGLTNKEIAKLLKLSQFTVRNHCNRINEKLHVSDRTEATMTAIQQGIITVSPVNRESR